MREFFKTHSNLITAAAGVVLAVILAVVAAAITVKTAKQMASGELSDISYLSEMSAPVESVPQGNGIQLVITSPSSLDTTVQSELCTITGTSDPAEPLLMNDSEVTRAADGSFSLEVQLVPGANTFTFVHKGETTVCTIRYNYVVIKAYSPSEKQQYEAGSSFVATALARVNSSSVTATFNGQTINLVRQPYAEGEEFANFSGTFTLPTGNENAINLGGVTFTAVCGGIKNTYKSAAIICLRDTALDGTQIVEIVAEQAETFNGNTTDDWSRPTNSYLPKGTVDHKVGSVVHDGDNSYYKLRSGQRVYIDKNNAPDTKRAQVSVMYAGELPDTNTVSLASSKISGKHSVFTFNTAWKAPFTVTLAPQGYNNPANQDYTISSATYSYIDIKFCYTQELGGDFTIPAGHPLFSRSEVYSAEGGFVLRLHLNKVGAFYGWNAEYNAAGQLVFSFLNPARLQAAGDLTGIKIVIDAGHGGRDSGALAANGTYESERNLNLANLLRAELLSRGATVFMTRTSDVTLTADERCSILRREAPDLCVSIHHDSNYSTSAHGGSILCFNAFSNAATRAVYNRTVAQSFYRKNTFGWHYFYMCRVTSCPVILTENGFISNSTDFAGIADPATNGRKATAIAEGIVDYFNSIQ